ncbi:hypothetical protein BCR34DRAFT_592529 [Clohesyomyces aquaticus]|uniref:Uncharacterized protein n=1 Tax=Clohesyomyces aquaticus TaxID=1231657 RepID=A0A1Y1YS25_9PLEO|nr:hypothetical protein BCR34DRAFT_592529 [Clohesyomyces aquaticus]
MEELTAAWDTLRNASEEDLRQYLEKNHLEATETIKRLKSLTPCSSPDGVVSKLLARRNEITEFFRQPVEDAVGPLPWTQGDYRLHDIQRNGDPDTSLPAEFRRALAEWSLAEDYVQNCPTILDDLIKKKSFNKSRTTQSISQFLRGNGIRRKNERALRRAINQGLKYITMHRYLSGSAKNTSYATGLLAFSRGPTTNSSFEMLVMDLSSGDLESLRASVTEEWLRKARDLYKSQDPRLAPKRKRSDSTNSQCPTLPPASRISSASPFEVRPAQDAHTMLQYPTPLLQYNETHTQPFPKATSSRPTMTQNQRENEGFLSQVAHTATAGSLATVPTQSLHGSENLGIGIPNRA